MSEVTTKRAKSEEQRAGSEEQRAKSQDEDAGMKMRYSGRDATSNPVGVAGEQWFELCLLGVFFKETSDLSLYTSDGNERNCRIKAKQPLHRKY